MTSFPPYNYKLNALCICVCVYTYIEIHVDILIEKSLPSANFGSVFLCTSDLFLTCYIMQLFISFWNHFIKGGHFSVVLDKFQPHV